MQDALPRQDLLDVLLADRKRFVEVAQRVLKCRARAEDVVQEAAIRIWQNGVGTVPHSPKSYVRRMIRNLAIDAVRQVGLECRLLAPIAEADETASPCTCPHERMEACQALKAVFAALDAAPARTRNAIIAHRLDGVPQKTIAAENGVSPTLVNFMIRDATALCRKALDGEAESAVAA
ncbi:MAG: sigma-70 family RNA polymerase sigma factor [Methylobacterium sp.]